MKADAVIRRAPISRALANFLVSIAAACSNAATTAENAAADAQAAQSGDASGGDNEETPQHASAEDMRIMEPYIGKFRSETKLFDDSDIEYFHTINYQWFDQSKTIVKYTVAMEIPSQERVIVSSEGFYGYDPFNNLLYVFGAFTSGASGWGAIGAFDHETHARAVWAKSMDAEGVVTHVRDRFELVDKNSWKNKTSIRRGADTDWAVVYEGAYTRMEEVQ